MKKKDHLQIGKLLLQKDAKLSGVQRLAFLFRLRRAGYKPVYIRARLYKA